MWVCVCVCVITLLEGWRGGGMDEWMEEWVWTGRQVGHWNEWMSDGWNNGRSAIMNG